MHKRGTNQRAFLCRRHHALGGGTGHGQRAQDFCAVDAAHRARRRRAVCRLGWHDAVGRALAADFGAAAGGRLSVPGADFCWVDLDAFAARAVTGGHVNVRQSP